MDLIRADRRMIINEKLKVLKFGGRSLANGEGIKQVLDIVKSGINSGVKMILVLSAWGDTEDQLET